MSGLLDRLGAAGSAMPSGSTPPRWPWGPPPSSVPWPCCWPWRPIWSSCAISTRGSTPGWPRRLAAASRGVGRSVGHRDGGPPERRPRRRPHLPVVGRGPTAPPRALIAGAPDLPPHPWTAGTGDTDGRRAAPSGSTPPLRTGVGSVAGESVERIGEVRDQLLIAEAVLGALLLVVTFVGSFLVGSAGLGPHRADPTAPGGVHRRRLPRAAHPAERHRGRGRPGPRAGAGRGQLPGDPAAGVLGERATPVHRRGPAVAGPGRRRPARRADRPGGRRRRGGRGVPVAVPGRGRRRLGHADRPGSIPRPPYAIRADADSVDRLISVLLDNACRYAGAGGTVDLGVARPRWSGGADRRRLGAGHPRGPPGPGLRPLPPGRRQAGRNGLGTGHRRRRGQEQWWAPGASGSSPAGGARMEVSWRPAPRPRFGHPSGRPSAPSP